MFRIHFYIKKKKRRRRRASFLIQILTQLIVCSWKNISINDVYQLLSLLRQSVVKLPRRYYSSLPKCVIYLPFSSTARTHAPLASNSSTTIFKPLRAAIWRGLQNKTSKLKFRLKYSF